MNLERIGCLRFRYSASSEEHWFNAFNVMGSCDSCIVFLNFLPQSLTRQVLQRFACHLVDMFLGNPCAFDAHLKSLLFMALLPPSKLLPPERMAYQEVISHQCPFISPLFNPCFRFLVVLIGVRRAMNYDSASRERKDEETPKAWPQRRISGWFSQSEAMKMTNRSPRKTHRPLWKWFLSCITQGLNTLNLWQVKRKIYKSLDLQAAIYWQKWTAIHGRNLCKEVVRWIFAAPCTTLAVHCTSTPGPIWICVHWYKVIQRRCTCARKPAICSRVWGMVNAGDMLCWFCWNPLIHLRYAILCEFSRNLR